MLFTGRQVQYLSVIGIGLALSLSGCGGPPKPPVGNVSGKVTLDGKPFTGGRVVFNGKKTGVGTAPDLQPDGSYSVVTPDGGIKVDTYEVAIQPPIPAAVKPEDTIKGIKPPEDTSKIPAKYRVFSTSGFSVEVKAGKNNADFEMKSQ